MSGSDEKAIVFFDGVCNLCNHTVSFIMARDQHDRFLYCPLQSKTESLTFGSSRSLDSVVVSYRGEVFRKSDAVIFIGCHLGGFWKTAILLKAIPRFVRDFAYSVVAKYRYVLFGKKSTCRLPTQEERLKFID